MAWLTFQAEDDESDEDDEDDEDAEQRLIWGPIKDIEDSNIKALTRRFIDRPVDEITNVTQNSGMNNAVYIVHYNSVPEICVRVPACGWVSHLQIQAPANLSSYQPTTFSFSTPF
jgi:hypothetical protein